MNTKTFIDLVEQVEKLKDIKRTGWKINGIENGESLSEHHFQVAFLAMLIADNLENIDKEKLIRMALIHDIGELIIGDQIILNRESEEGKAEVLEKHQKELDAVRQIFRKMENGKIYIKLYEELNDKKTREAKLVKEIDMLQMALQALEYEDKFNKKLDTFFQNSGKYIFDKNLREIFGKVCEKRKTKNR